MMDAPVDCAHMETWNFAGFDLLEAMMTTVEVLVSSQIEIFRGWKTQLNEK
jgi:hypothetical protein